MYRDEGKDWHVKVSAVERVARRSSELENLTVGALDFWIADGLAFLHHTPEVTETRNKSRKCVA
jgi:hypothetical protein